MKTPCLILAAAALLTSCAKQKSSNAASKAPTPPSAALEQVLSKPPAEGPKPIHIVRTTVQPGDEVTLSGRIMGAAEPFVAGRAVFILGDPEILTPCNELPGDSCESPWDTCCETPEEKRVGTATIQVVDAQGQVLKESLEGVGGLEKLAFVTVTGKVAVGSSADVLLVNAEAIRAGK